MKILNFGSCNIDYVYFVDHIVNVGETISSNKLEIFAGGKGLNQSIAAARAGATIYHVGCLGKDGEMLRAILNDSGVNTEYLYTTDEKNGHAIIQVSMQGENSIFLYNGSNYLITKQMVDSVLEKFNGDDVLLLQNEISNVHYIIEKAYKKGMKIAFNPAPFDDSLRSIDFSMLSFLILNETEAMGFTGKSEPMESIEYIKNNYPDLAVILTVGKEGCIYNKGDVTYKQAAFKVKAVDTTAAGDTFIGYFLSCVCQSMPVKQALRISSAASAITVSKMGAAPSIPVIEDVKNQLVSMQEYEMNSSSTVAFVIEKYIKNNLIDANLGELSKRLGYTKEYTSELVKKVKGEKFSVLLQILRCEKAAELLINTDNSISDIISQTGYANESFFRKKFSSIYGFSPLGYRKEYRK